AMNTFKVPDGKHRPIESVAGRRCVIEIVSNNDESGLLRHERAEELRGANGAGPMPSLSGADLTFATYHAASPRSECQIQRSTSTYDLLGRSDSRHSQEEPAANGCECLESKDHERSSGEIDLKPPARRRAPAPTRRPRHRARGGRRHGLHRTNGPCGSALPVPPLRPLLWSRRRS